MTPRERELLTGMGNCFEACHSDFEGTIEMVGGYRKLTAAQVREFLLDLRTRHGDDPEYRQLRERLPAEFPF
ncbi:MAG: hypothetical protein L3K17_00570 [Thermoplasmata archaeon]|nr:hypothetical protein [Thermoplasmata archaeon]